MRTGAKAARPKCPKCGGGYPSRGPQRHNICGGPSPSADEATARRIYKRLVCDGWIYMSKRGDPEGATAERATTAIVEELKRGRKP